MGIKSVERTSIAGKDMGSRNSAGVVRGGQYVT
jgi:hypothetical protein